MTLMFFFFLIIRRPPKSTLFPYPTPSRSADPGRRPQGPRRAVPPARLPLLAAAGAAPGALRQQDGPGRLGPGGLDRKSTRLNSSHANISYAVFCLKKKNKVVLDNTVLISS